MEWIEVAKQKPKCNDKFKESNLVLCYAKNGGQFVGWYNEESNEWHVAHFTCTEQIYSAESIPTHWMELPENPCEN